jgi:hypothetical protein
MGYVEDAFEARTMHGRRRVLARRGRAGELRDFFSILSEKTVIGYCEALPILVQQRPCVHIRFTVGVHFSERGARHPIGRTN